MTQEEKTFTLRDLLNMAGESTPKLIMFKMQFAQNHADRLDCVRKAVDYVAQEFAKAPQHRQNMGEDALTNDIILALKSMGFQAYHDVQYGGHCDITVEARDDFLWIAEAKIHGAYEWLLKGFQQLDTRYTTGLIGQDNGEMIIYIHQRRTDMVMSKWADELLQRRSDVSVEIDKQNNGQFISTHVHARTGRIFTVRHVSISLYFCPKDS